MVYSLLTALFARFVSFYCMTIRMIVCYCCTHDNQINECVCVCGVGGGVGAHSFFFTIFCKNILLFKVKQFLGIISINNNKKIYIIYSVKIKRKLMQKCYKVIEVIKNLIMCFIVIRPGIIG